MKWLPHAQSARRSDAVGPMRMVSTSLADLADAAAARPRRPAPVRRRRAAGHPAPPAGDRRRRAAARQPRRTPRRPARRHPPRPARAVGRARGRHPAADPARRRAARGRAPRRSARCGCARRPSGPRPTSARWRTAEAFARRLTPLHTVAAGRVAETSPARSPGAVDFMELLALGDVRAFDPDAAWRPRPARDRLRVPIGTRTSGGRWSTSTSRSPPSRAWARTAW